MFVHTFTVLGGFAIVVSAIAWLIRSMVNHLLSKDVETYKEILKSESAIELEQLKAKLQQEYTRDRIRYEMLQKTRCDALALLYQQLLKSVAELRKCASLSRGDVNFSKWSREALVNAHQTYVEAKNAFEINEIYFGPELRKIIERFLRLLEVSNEHRGIFEEFDNSWKDKYGPGFLEAWEPAEKMLPGIKRALKDEIRTVMGADDISVDDSALCQKTGE